MSQSSTEQSKIFIKIFAGLLSAVCAVAIFAGVYSVVNDDGVSSDEVSWLYSQTADSGELDEREDGTFHLILRNVDYHTVQFSDRPDRLVEVIDTADLVKNWDILFATSSPNAVLVEHEPEGSTDSLVVVLQKPHFNYAEDELTYEVTLLSDEEHPERLKKLANAHVQSPVAMRAVSLFIDSVTSTNAPTSPIFTGPAADKLKSLLGLPSIPTEPLNLGNGVQVLSAEATTDANGAVTAQAVVGFNSGSFTLNMKLAATDSKNWTLTASPGATTPWTNPKVPGLTIDPSTFSGTISNVNGKISFNLTGGTHSWNVATGATYVSTLSFSSDCSLTPATRCPASVTGPFISMNGALTISGFPNTITMSGAMTPNAEWARFDGKAGNLTFAGTGVTNTTLTMWRGARDDAFNSNLQLPTLAKLASGNNLEFCGGFTIAIPKIGNAATDGCVRWSPSGVVIGQVGVGGSVSGSMPSTGSTAPTSADVKGLAFTDISESDLNALPSRDAIMSGVAVAVQNKTVVLAGQAQLPGVVADALNINSSKITSFSVDIRGQVSRTGFSLSGDINTNINIGAEPFKITVRKMTLTVAVEEGAGASFGIGTSGNATLGYSPSTRTLSTSIEMVAATSPQMGMSLSVNARGTAATNDSGKDGLTVATRLTNPSGAQYVWPDQFGIKGLNLWNLTVQIAFIDGSPALGYTSTTYMDPNGAQTKNVLKCTGTCDSSDWMIGSLGLNISYTNPCLAYGFESASGTSGFVIDKGVLMATSFKVGVAPNGCSIQSGDVQQSLPIGFVGFQFSAKFGDAPGTTLNVATKTSVDGYVFQASATNLKVAGMEYKSLVMNVNITTSSSQFYFNADMTSGMGNMKVTANFEANTTGMKQTLQAELTNWGWKKSGTVDLKVFKFNTAADIPLQGGCARFSADASGSLTVGSRAFTLVGASFAFQCDKITNLYLKVLYEHTVKWNPDVSANSHLELKYPYNDSGKTYLYGDVGFSYERHFSKKYKGKTFSRDVDVSFDMTLEIDTGNPAASGFSFRGDFNADRVSGAVGCSMDPGAGDFTCGGELRLNPSWAGVYHFDWGDM
jgi:hypothetical protein